MPDPATAPEIQLHPWTDADLALLRRVNSPEMTRHLGGPESEERLLDRHQRYLGHTGPETGVMYAIVLPDTGERVGTIGYWHSEWRDSLVYATGWGVLPEYQGRGIAVRAAALAVSEARAAGAHRYLHAFPSRANAASNAVCRKVGFTLLGECEVEYPRDTGQMMHCHDWRMDLRAIDLRAAAD